jgi:D-alanyl-D-alanine carboxypeptidase (penicillin-binding protein 5/6)
VVVAGALLWSATPAAAAPASPARPAQAAGEAQAAILIDPQTGAVLEARREHEPLPVAGAVKLLTALTALQRLPSDTRVAVTPTAANAPEPTLGMDLGADWQQLDLLQSMLLSSHNDSAYALAEGAAGSLDSFVDEMSRVGSLMGLEDSTFGDPAGTDDPNAPGGPSQMSAYDLAVVAANVLATPELAEVVSLFDYRVTRPGQEDGPLTTSSNTFITAYEGATGMITTSSGAAGEVVVASAARDGRALIAVVLNAGNANGVAAAMLDRGFLTPPETKGTGAQIPDTRITTIEGRLLAITGLPRPLGAPAIPFGATGPGAPVADAAPPTPAQPAESETGDGGGSGFPFLQVLALLAGAAIVVLLAYRHRAVQRARLRRQARERQLHNARRRGTIDVIEPEVAIDPDDIKIVRP